MTDTYIAASINEAGEVEYSERPRVRFTLADHATIIEWEGDKISGLVSHPLTTRVNRLWFLRNVRASLAQGLAITIDGGINA